MRRNARRRAAAAQAAMIRVRRRTRSHARLSFSSECPKVKENHGVVRDAKWAPKARPVAKNSAPSASTRAYRLRMWGSEAVSVLVPTRGMKRVVK
jgi:hypothetical protein